MTRRLLFCALALLALAGTACGRYLTTGVAVVNGSSISKDDLDRQFDAVKNNPSFSGVDAIDIQRQIIVGLIQQQLILQEADRLHISVSEADIDQQLAQVRSSFADEAAFGKALTANKLTVALLREQLRVRILIQLVQQRVIAGISATEAEIRQAYGNGARFEEIRVRHILFGVTGTNDKPARAKAEAALKQIRAGADFAAIARAQSDDTGSKAKGGDLGYVTREVNFDQTFLTAAFKLRKGQTSGLVRTQFGFHIIRVDDRRTKTLAQARTQLAQELTQSKQQQVFQDYVRGRVEAANIRVNPRYGDFNATTLSIDSHQFFVPPKPAPQTQPVLLR